jgi:sulfate adenylyltransferase subunit 2
MPQLIKNRAVADDRWTLLREATSLADVPAGTPVIVPLALWKAERSALVARGDAGVWLSPSDEPAELESDISALPLIAVDFPKFTDGRGYSTARLLRERYRFEGELRAIGDVLRDQLFALAQCGFDAFALRADRNATEALPSFDDFAGVYAPTTSTPQPWFRRRIAAAATPVIADDLEHRIADAVDALRAIADRHAPAVFASSFGAEDMVVIDLIAKHRLPIRVFTLDTGRLPDETHALIDRTRKRYDLPVDVYAPDTRRVQGFVRAHGVNAFYDSVELRKNCCAIRKAEPLSRALVAKGAWITGQRRDNRSPEATCRSRSSTRCMTSPSSTRSPIGARRTSGPTFAPMTCRTMRSMTAVIRPSAALPALARSNRARIFAPAAGGGSARAQGMRVASTQRRHPRGRERERSRDAMTVEALDSSSRASAAVSAVAPADADHLGWRESEAIHILREVAGQCHNPALLFSGGKDSLVLLRLAEKAFRPGPFPFPLLHIDTGHNFPEVIAFRDRRVEELGERLIVRTVEESIAAGRVVLKHTAESRNAYQSVTLLDAIAEFGFDACIGGARATRKGPRQGADLLVPRCAWTVGPEEPAARALESLQRAHARWRKRPRVPDFQLDGARCLAIHRARSTRGPVDLPGTRARSFAAARHSSR